MRLFCSSFLASASLLVGVAVAWFWAASFAQSHHAVRTSGADQWGIMDGRGGLMIERLRLIDPTADERMAGVHWTYTSRSPAISLDRYVSAKQPSLAMRATGFGWNRFTFGRFHHQRLFLPYWFVLLLTLVIPATWYRRHLGTAKLIERRRARCECVYCGYDMRASPTRCPECGRAMA